MSQKQLAERYDYLGGDNPLTSKNEAKYGSFGGWMSAAGDALSTGWYGDPTDNPHLSTPAKRSKSSSDKTTRGGVAYAGAGSAAGQAAASQMAMGASSGRTTGYNDRRDVAGALTQSGNHGDVGVSDLTDYGTIRGSEQSRMLAEQDKGMNDSDGGGSDGGTVICTELYRQGLMSLDVYCADQRFGARLMQDDPHVIAGYHLWARPVVRLMRKSKPFTWVLFKSLAEPWAKEMAAREGLNGIGTLRGKALMVVGMPLCRMIGRAQVAYRAWVAREEKAV